ncbi:putative Bud site selection protein BUD4 [Mollisia scopiformis]|uniref:Putative Bud site selection protein BUD4 n=1 Tax=Mollisia scopiformis TaxID=149040 RepID=A0A194XFR6_MOLSC|nr:putative Bud site selection protein BUD4 [Mollisia scopiformis]KUJ19040.1 putative Bud site selection protein BUD4 [Mollisia scopiformis]
MATSSPSAPVHPLRIQKGTPSTSPTKMTGSSLPRPLSELAPTEKRRNSPSYNQATKKMVLNQDSSPFQSSPFNASEGNSSPRLFWNGRSPTTPNRINTENLFAGRESSPSPTRRSSIERLQKASRVKNSNMFAREQKQEYDPASVPVIERPLAKQLQGNAYGGAGLDGLRSAERGRGFGHQRNDSKSSIPLYSSLYSPNKTPLKASANALHSPSKDQISPTKSSLASGRFNGKSSFDSENGTWSDEVSGDERQLPPGRILHRHAKSVTFDAAPPQVNEYEMATPDMSSVGTGSRENSYDSGEDEDEDSYNRGDSIEQDDSFDASLEDTDKTPVVGPDDWRHASPGAHDTGIVSGRFEDPFEGPEGSPMPDARPSSSLGRPTASRTDSLNSNGEHRPLPPLPGMDNHKRSGSTSSTGLSAAAERATQRGLPSPPAPASISKSEIQGMSGGKMTLEERLRLMMIQDEEKPKTEAEKQRERRMRRAGARERSSQTPERDPIHIHEDEDTLDDLPGLGTYQLPPRISRESILRKVNGQEAYTRESDYNFSSPMPSSSPERPTPLDPDTPIPSTEDQSMIDNEDSVIIKREPEDEESDVDVYSIPEMYQRTESRMDDYNENDENLVEELESQFSDPTLPHQSPQMQSSSAAEDDGPPTPRPQSPQAKATDIAPVKQDNRESLPEFSGFLSNNDFGLSLQSYMAPSPPPKDEQPAIDAPKMAQAHEYLQRPETPQERQVPAYKPEYDGSGWGPEEEDEFEVGTPESVIRHQAPPSPARDSPSIPEQVATIKSASGSKLKTRPSATPSDLIVMREMRRQVSGETRNIPPIPERHRNRPSLSADRELEDPEYVNAGVERQPSFKRSLTLDIGSDIGLGLDQDFDRVIEAQKVAFDLSSSQSTSFHKKGQASATDTVSHFNIYANMTPRKQRGYLMRQNTKLVVASSNDGMGEEFRGTRSAGNSPIKQDRPQSWTVEPWNGQMRKNSIRDRSGARKKATTGPVPPMPGQESNVAGLGIVSEESMVEPVPEDGGERGRLFVKVIGVKDLDMPLPKNEQTWFSLTLDNGVHCVTTAWLELGRNAPIGQEFELVVPNELEFQLTLNAKLVKPPPKRVVESPTKTHKAQKPSTFSRVFASPKKRKELEMRQKEEEQRVAEQNQRDTQAKRMSVQPTAWDLLSPLAAEDGSFGRSYVCLKDHEARCYGRPYVVDVACFNEWATEEANHKSSVMSKRGNTNIQRRAPYKVAKLELQLLFVPKPRGATDDDMPKSMNSCIREMKEAEAANARNWEGHLSQQGGDCPYWRRRYFKLTGSKLTAYHESTRQPRATINLANASKLIDDRRTLTQKETTGKNGKRRKSGFAEEEEGYMFVEEGFRIRFNNGEIIDFYADTANDKEGWMQVLDGCIGKEGSGAKGGWCDLVLKREGSLKRRNEQGTTRKTSRNHQRTKSMVV